MSSASAGDCTHWRANRSNPGATSEKQFLQFSWLAMGSMTFSRSLLSRRRQVEILSMNTNKRWGGLAEPTAARPAVAPYQRYVFGNARRIKLPSQSECATPWRYARNDSTEEFTRRLLYEPSAFCQRSCQ